MRPGRKKETDTPFIGFKARPGDYELIQGLVKETMMTNRDLIMSALYHYQSHLISKKRAA